MCLAVEFSPVLVTYWVCCGSDLDNCATDPYLLLCCYLEINYWSLKLSVWCWLLYPEPLTQQGYRKLLQLVRPSAEDIAAAGSWGANQQEKQNKTTSHDSYNNRTVKAAFTTPLHTGDKNREGEKDMKILRSVSLVNPKELHNAQLPPQNPLLTPISHGPSPPSGSCCSLLCISLFQLVFWTTLLLPALTLHRAALTWPRCTI